MLEAEALGEPRLPFVGKDGDVVPSIGAADDTAQSDGEDVVEAVPLALSAARVLNVVKVLRDHGGGGGCPAAYAATKLECARPEVAVAVEVGRARRGVA